MTKDRFIYARIDDMQRNDARTSTDYKEIETKTLAKDKGLINKKMSSTPITTDKAKVAEEYEEGEIVNIENTSPNNSINKKAQGLFQVVNYTEKPPFFIKDIPDIMYQVTGKKGNNKKPVFQYLINSQLLYSFCLTCQDEQEILTLKPFINDSASVLFNLANKKHCVIIDNKIKYLKYEE
ncbi:MAG: hypothetical protein IMY67_12170 [Bacteroidetes bacterium]|nr:hypothetical protein [Bacteroidota bacterium]